MIPDFKITAESAIADAFLAMGLNSFNSACHYVQQLPYGRNAERGNFLSVLAEGKGTCSSKHGLLAQLAEIHGENEIHLMVGIFLMSGETHPTVEDILKKHELKAIPEAHSYFRVDGKRYDFTAKEKDISTIEPFIIREQRCEPNQLIEWKPMIHKHYLEGWLKRQKSTYSPEEIWEIREACIAALE